MPGQVIRASDELILPKNIAICGIDEAGRGPLAGPVYAAAVVLPSDFPSDELDDSKRLSAAKRELLAPLIKERAYFGIGSATHLEIDEVNILQATFLAMRRAYAQLLTKLPPAHEHAIYIDGNRDPKIDTTKKIQLVIKGDSRVPAIMAASILAKTERDRVMLEYDKLYPQYGYSQHKGYGTALHRERLHRYGPSPIQRLYFKY